MRNNRRLANNLRIGSLCGMTILVIGLTAFIALRNVSAALAVPAAPEWEWQELIAKAETSGPIRVIVGLDVAFSPEGEQASPQGVQNQQQLIRRAQNEVIQQLAGYNVSLIANFKYIPYMALLVDAAALDKLSSLPQVASIQEDQLSSPSLASSIPVIGADAAWATGYAGSGQTVAVLDTGVDKTHSFFSGGKVVSEACYSTTGSDPANGRYYSVCPGGVPASTAVGSGIDCTAAANGYPAAQADCQHGTHVTGIAAGNGGGTANIGVARDANIIAVQVFSLFIDLNGIFSWDSDQIRGLERVYELRDSYNIAAVNMSVGGSRYYSPASCDAANPGRKAAIDNLRSVGIATVAAAGNAGYKDSMGAPACISSAISVGATDDGDIITSFSNIAPFVDLLTPGADITSSIPGGGTASYNGTSMSTPHVAGAWAVVRQFAPNASIDDILTVFKNTGTLVNDTRPGGMVNNIPRLNLDQALNSLNRPPTALDDGAPTPLNTAVTINVLQNDSDPDNDALAITDVGAAGHGTAVQVSSTSIQFTPAANYSGADSFTYTIADSHGQEASAAVFVIVDGQSLFLPAAFKD